MHGLKPVPSSYGSGCARGAEEVRVLVVGEEVLVVFAGDGGFHEVHPDGERGFGAGLFFAERLAAVIAHPDAAGDRGREAEEPGIGEVRSCAGFAADGVVEGVGLFAGADFGDGSKERHHGARGLLVDDLIDGGRVLPEGDAVSVFDLADEARMDAEAVIWEDGVAGDLFLQGDFDCAERDRQVSGDVGGDAEAMGDVDDLVDADAGGELEGGDVARLGKGVGEAHGTLVVVLVVVRNVAAEADGSVDDGVVGSGAGFDGGRIDVRFEAGAGLPFCLCGAVELGERVVAAADHGEHVAGGVVDGQERALGAGVLLEGGAAGATFRYVRKMDIDEVAGLDEGVGVALAGPLPVIGYEHDVAGADAGVNLHGKHAGDDGVDVVAWRGFHGPVRVGVGLDEGAGGEDVFELALPAVAALVGGEAVHDGVVGGLLQIEVEGGLDAQAGFVDLFGAEALFELAADFFLEPGSDGHLWLGDVEAERRRAGFFCLRVSDGAVGLHLREDEIAAFEGFLRIEERRIGGWALGQASEEGSFGQRNVFGVLAEVEFGSGFKAIHAVAEVDLIAVEGEYLLLGEGALDLDGEVGFLNFARGVAVSGEEEIARELHGERGSALHAAAAAEVVPDGADDAEDVDAPVRLEVLVFDGDDGLAEDRGELVVVDQDAALEGEGADDAAFYVEEIGGGGRAIALEVVDLGQVDGVDEREASERAGDDREREQSGENDAARDFATWRGGGASAGIAGWKPGRRRGWIDKAVRAAETARRQRLSGGASQRRPRKMLSERAEEKVNSV